MRRLTRGSLFVEGCLRALTREVCFREMLSRTLLFSTFWKRELPHLHGHIFPFIGTSSPSRAHLPPHLPLHWHIFPFRQVGGGRGLGMVCFRESFRRDTRGTLSEKRPIKFMARLHTLSFPRFAYADCLCEDYREASAKCLRVPTRTCKYQCFGFRGVNMSSPHKKDPSFQKKTWLRWRFGCPAYLPNRMFITFPAKIFRFLRVPGCPRGGGSWGTLRIPFGKIGVP